MTPDVSQSKVWCTGLPASQTCGGDGGGGEGGGSEGSWSATTMGGGGLGSISSTVGGEGNGEGGGGEGRGVVGGGVVGGGGCDGDKKIALAGHGLLSLACCAPSNPFGMWHVYPTRWLHVWV